MLFKPEGVTGKHEWLQHAVLDYEGLTYMLTVLAHPSGIHMLLPQKSPARCKSVHVEIHNILYHLKIRPYLQPRGASESQQHGDALNLTGLISDDNCHVMLQSKQQCSTCKFSLQACIVPPQ